MQIRGWVYVIRNKAMPGLVKVGFSTKDPTLRAKELANTGTPHPYEVIYDALVEEPRRVEASVHSFLHMHREGREWFRCSAAVAVNAIRQNAETLLGERVAVAEACKVQETNVVADTPDTPDTIKHCFYANCPNPVVRNYKGRYLCAAHDESEREYRFAVARYRRED
jgi:hypothetical protein